MNQYGIQFEVKNKPSLDPEFMPILQFNRAFLKYVGRTPREYRYQKKRPETIITIMEDH